MSATNDVLTGRWVDYSRGSQTYILTSDFRARIMTTLVAVSITLSAPYIFKIVRSIIIQTREAFRAPTSDAQEPLLARAQPQNSSTSSENHEDHVQQILEDARGGREVTSGLLKYILQHPESFSIPHVALVIMIISAIFISFGAQVIAGAFSGNIVTSRAARSSSTTCGIWEFDEENAGDEAAARSDVYDYRMEARAASYAQNCYNSQMAVDSIRCDFFYNSSIGYNTTRFDKCPFDHFELCRGGLYSAVTFDTGLVDANIIGVNSKAKHKFRRQTTCSPLNMDTPYVQIISSVESNDTKYRYYYGSIYDEDGIETKNYTYETSGNPFNWLAPVYSLMSYSTSLYPEYDYWRPISALEPTSNSTLTIFFISSMHIYHLKPSFDPIFPATTPYQFPQYRDPFYYNSDPRAQALACVDTTYLCSPDGASCWSMTESPPSNIPEVPSNPYWFMKWSLEASNAYDSVKWRLGSSLLAQQKISSSVSQPLSDHYWETEAENIFATSLARIQFDAWGIAIGEGRSEPGYVEVTPDEAKGHLCGIWKFRSVGFTNISLKAFVLLMMVPFFTGVLSLEVEPFKKTLLKACPYGKAVKNKKGEDGKSGDILVLNLIFSHIGMLIGWLLKSGILLLAQLLPKPE